MKYTHRNLHKSKLIRKLESVFLTAEIEKSHTDSKNSKRLIPLLRENAKQIHISRIRYLSNDHEVVGFIVEPRKSGKYPCIIYNRGGTGEFGKIEPWQLFSRIGGMAAQGYVVFASQYSGNDGGEGKDEFGGKDVDDILNLFPIIDQYQKADNTRIGMYGHSRGGMMTYLALRKTKRIKAAVIVAGLANLKRNLKLRDKHFTENMKKVFPFTPRNLQIRSAISFAQKLPKTTPILLMHGTADWRVSALDSLEIAQKLQGSKHPFRLVIYEGADHELVEIAGEPFNSSVKWFDRFVCNQGELPNMKPHGS